MKKLFALLLTAGMCLTACAAGETTPPKEPDPVLSGPAETLPVSQPGPENPSDEISKEVPDYDLYISDQPIPTVEGCGITDRLPVYFINNTGEDGYVLSIPHLEKLDDNGAWAEVPYKDDIGFCGTPDPLPAAGREWSEEISFLWGRLEDGQYRLSYAVGPTQDTEETVSGEFTLYTPENNAGLPLAPQD